MRMIFARSAHDKLMHVLREKDKGRKMKRIVMLALMLAALPAACRLFDIE